MFTIVITTETAAFDGDPGGEVARILEQIAATLYASPGAAPMSGTIRDLDGFQCGVWQLAPEQVPA